MTIQVYCVKIVFIVKELISELLKNNVDEMIELLIFTYLPVNHGLQNH